MTSSNAHSGSHVFLEAQIARLFVVCSGIRKELNDAVLTSFETGAAVAKPGQSRKRQRQAKYNTAEVKVMQETSKKESFVYAAIFVTGLVTFLAYLFLFGYSLGKAVEILLIGTGWLIMLIGLFLLSISRVTRDKPFIIMENQEVEIKGKDTSYNFVFPIEHRSTIKGKITVQTTRSPFSVSIFKFLGQLLWTETSEWLQKPYISYRFLRGAGAVDFGPIDLEPGSYYLNVRTETLDGFKALIDADGVYHVRPNVWVYDLACTLLEIGIPLIVTGLILFAGK